MNHTATGPDAAEGGDDDRSVANPRRTRVGADGRPISGPATSSTD
jgi:hypothetical protein